MLPITPKRRESKGGQAPLAEREGRALEVLPFNHAESPNRLWLYEKMIAKRWLSATAAFLSKINQWLIGWPGSNLFIQGKGAFTGKKFSSLKRKDLDIRKETAYTSKQEARPGDVQKAVRPAALVASKIK